MIKFDVVDFSERRCEEVISFFWRSVCNITMKDIEFYNKYGEKMSPMGFPPQTRQP